MDIWDLKRISHSFEKQKKKTFQFAFVGPILYNSGSQTVLPYW